MPDILTNNYWTPERPNARFPRPTKNDLTNAYVSDQKTIDASYLRLKNLQLMYQLPRAITKEKVNQLSVYVSSTNIFTFSKMEYFKRGSRLV